MNTLKLSSIIEDRHKCRCCIKPAVNCIKLESFVNICGDVEKTYREIFNEITNLNERIPPCKEPSLPQQICMECSIQIVNSYKFIQQACKVSELYLNLEGDQNTQDDFKSLQETLMEITEKPTLENDYKEIKIEPVNIEFNEFSNEEADESEPDNEERHFIENSSEEDSNVPESLNEYDLSTEPTVRRCDICFKIYKNEHTLKIHKHYIHMPDEDKISCPLCTYKASRSSALKAHMGLEHGMDKVSEYFKPVGKEKTRKYSCNFCSNSYVRKYSLRTHICRKHKQKAPEEIQTENIVTEAVKPKEKERFLCTYCGKSYSFKNSLKTHILSHTGERPYACEICNKTFRRSIGLTMHRVIHSDEKPHKCHVCGKCFKLIGKLKFHMRVHSELRPFKCSQCEKSFKYASVLKSHMLMHTGELPFACKTCGEAFALRTSLNYHCLKNVHEK